MTVEPQDTPLRRGMAQQRDPEGSLRVTAPTGAVVVLNPTAAALWELLDGQTTVEEVLTAATSLFAGSPGTIRREIEDTLRRLREQQLTT